MLFCGDQLLFYNFIFKYIIGNSELFNVPSFMDPEDSSLEV
jgi:hypothetical protein